jgi:predicted permease
MLALLGGAAGVLIADWVLRLLVGFQPPLPIPIRLDVGIDARVLLFTLLVSTAAGILFGLAPGLHATRPQLGTALRDEAGNVTTGRRHGRLRSALVAGQVSLSLLLLVGAGLFLRSLSKAQQIDPGFDTGPAALLWPMPELSGLNETEARAVRDRLYETLRTLPGVTAVARTDRLPLGFAIQTREMQFDGVAPPPGLDAHHLDFTQVDSAYFEVMRVPLVSGRTFTSADRAGEAVAVISEEAARRFWTDGNALGQRFWLGENRETPVRVIGIARDTRVRTLGEAPRPYVYLNAEQSGVVLQFIIRGTLPATELVRVAAQAARDAYPQLVIMEAKTMEEHLGIMLFAPRMAALLLSVFGGLALALAAIGLYGTVSYAVARRTREVGIRSALGASRRELELLLTRGGMRLITIGSAIGLVLAAALTWSIAGFLYGIRATDAFTFVGVPLGLGLVGFLASWLPARRAARVDPMRALRTE